MITSTQNQQVKFLSKLSKRSERYKNNQYIVYGEKLVSEALRTNVVKNVFTTEDKDENAIIVSPNVMKKIVGGANVNIAALCEMKTQNFTSGSTIILDNLQDPGNVGTIIRSAKAFGINNVLLGEGTVDLYNDKVLRSMQGVNFHMNIQCGNIEKYLSESTNYLITTFLDEASDDDGYKINNFDLIVGNEGNGIDKKYKLYTHTNIKLDIEFESLNVATAASIIMYKLKEKK